MKFAVSGGLGFIGSHTVVALHNAGHDVVIIDDLSNSRIEVLASLNTLCGRTMPFYKADITDEAGLRAVFSKEKEMTGLIHFAAKKSVPESLEKPLWYYENNIKGLIHMMRMLEDFEVNRFVFSSSCTVYGQPDQVPVTESTPTVRSLTPYGSSKLWAEQMIEEYTRLRNALCSISLRYFNPVGAHESALICELPLGVPGNLMPFITQTAAGWRKELKVFGNDYSTRDGTAIRDYIHVVDLAEAHVKAIEYAGQMPESQRYDVFNVGTGNGHTVLEVIASFERSTGQKLAWSMAPRRQGDIEQIWADTRKAEQVLGWKARLNLDDMTTSAWKAQRSLIERGFKP